MMYFPNVIYNQALEDYSKSMKKNPSSVKSYMARNPEWAMEITFIYLDIKSGISDKKYIEMKNDFQTKKRSTKKHF